MQKKKRQARPDPTPDVNPAWLAVDPRSGPVAPPTKTRRDRLPYLEIDWADFERLARRLAGKGGQVEAAWSYGTVGQAQYGVDILVRLADGNYEVWQTKRYSKVNATDIKEAGRIFLRHKWAAKANRFVLAVACEMASTKVVEGVETLRDQLKSKKIEFEPLDAVSLTLRLKGHPEIIDDFFDREWVKEVCPPEAVKLLEGRFSRFQHAALRERLRECYGAWMATIDPGLLIAGQDRRGQIQPAISIADRYVQPDLIVPTPGQDTPPDNPQQSNSVPGSVATGTEAQPPGTGQDQLDSKYVTQEIRVPLDRYLATESRAIISADAGAGKSALLRFLALDMLSEAPVLTSVRGRYTRYLPIWIPFALWARMATEQRRVPSLADVVAEFLRAQGESAIIEDVLHALEDGRVVYLVDGLDEATDARAAETLAALLTTSVEKRDSAAFVTSRPQGLLSINRFGSTWKRAELATLSDLQKFELCRIWFQILARLESSAEADAVKVLRTAENRTKGFMQALRRSPSILRLSQTPLFLLALMDLARHGHVLPQSRFAANREIVAQLIEHQPRSRDTGALAVVTAPMDGKLRDRLIGHFAFALHAGTLRGAVTDSASEEDAIAHAVQLIQERQSTPDAEKAEALARGIFQFIEERAGLLVKKAPGNIGFLHLSLQEYLAARHLQQWALDRRGEFIRKHAAVGRWREPILNLLFLTEGEHDVGRLLQAIADAPTEEPTGARARDELLADAVFANFDHDLDVVRRLSEVHFAEVETTASGRRLRHLLTSVVDGLGSEAIGAACRKKLAEWMPDRHGYSRAGVIKAMPRWNRTLATPCVEALLRSLPCGEAHVWRPAGEVLAELAPDPAAAKSRVLALLKDAPDASTVAASLHAIGCGWHKDGDVEAIASSSRLSSDRAIAYEAIRIRVRRRETDERDLKLFASHAYGKHRIHDRQFIPDLAQHFASTQRSGCAALLRSAYAEADASRRDIKAIIGAMLYCDAADAIVTEGLKEALSHEWMWREIFDRSEFPSDRIMWTPELTDLAEKYVAEGKDRFREYEFYWLSKTLKLPTLKSFFLKNLTEGEHPSFWSASALVEGWGADDPEVREAICSLWDAPAERFAMIAKVLPDVVPDRAACRTALLRGLSQPHNRVDFVLDGLRKLPVARDDEEVFAAVWKAKEALGAPLYRNLWRAGVIRTFPWRHEVRELALEEIERRDGEVVAVAESYIEDADVCRRLLDSMAPLADSARLILVPALQEAGVSNSAALSLLASARSDTERGITAAATIAHAEVLVSRDGFDAAEVEFLSGELDALGPDYEQRRLAAVISIATGGQVDRLVAKRDHKGEPETFRLSMASVRGSNLFLNKILPLWDKLVAGFGSEDELLSRLEISGETLLPLLNPSLPNAERLFGKLYRPPVAHLRQHAEIALLAGFRPGSQELRALVSRLLLAEQTSFRSGHGWDVEYLGGLVAAEVFAEQFGDDGDLRAQLVGRALSDPIWTPALAALAEHELRHPDADVARILRDRTAGAPMDLATFFKVMSAVAMPERIIQLLATNAFERRIIDSFDLECERWVPALVRRVGRDESVRRAMFERLALTQVPSELCSYFALLREAHGVDERLQASAIEALRIQEQQAASVIGFDVVSRSHQPLRRILNEIVSG